MAAGSRYATGAVAQVGAPPAAMRVEGGSVGSQIGASETDIVLLVTNDGGMKHLLSDKFTVGGEAQLWQTICRRLRRRRARLPNPHVNQVPLGLGSRPSGHR